MAYTTIDDPSTYFQTLLYTGNGNSSQAQTNTGNSNLQPDWIWIKKRNNIRNTTNTDSSRGFNKRLETQTNVFETTTTDDVISAQSNGFTVGNNGSTGANGDTYVAWQWKANGGTTASNTDGSITSTVQANTTAGFSIVTYTGTGSTATVGHGLGSTPDMLIFKKRSASDNWYVYHSANTSAPETDYLVLDTTDATTNFNIWNNTAPTSSVFSISNAGVHANGQTMVCYAFAEKQGYSKFGSYIGGGGDNRAFVYTGMKPAWLMIKRTDSSTDANWYIVDNKRNTFNVLDLELLANSSAAENFRIAIDFLSNGFKIRNSASGYNAAGGTYIYMAFAEHPFVSSDGVPTTAR